MPIPLNIRRAIRSLTQYPSISVMAVLALGLGIGLPTAMFSMVDAALLRGLPVEDPASVMHLERRRIGASGEGQGAAPRDFLAWNSQQQAFSALAAYRTGTAALRSEQSVVRVEAGWMSPNTYSLLGVRAVVGRTFDSTDVRADAQPPVVLGWRVWRDHFASDRDVVGRTIAVDGVAHTVVGVMAQNFRFPVGQDLWMPMTIAAAAESDTLFPRIEVVGRLKPNVSRNTAIAEFAVIAERVAQTYPITNRGYNVSIKPFAERYMGETATTTMYVMLGAVLLVLVVACANVANLLLVRAFHRSRDMAISMALGASRRVLIRQVLLESAVLAVVGGGLGLLVAQAGVMGFVHTLKDFMPFWAEPRLDASVLLFAMVLAAVAAVLAGVVPAWRVTASDLSKMLRDDSRGSTGGHAGRVMNTLIVVELALSMGLLVTTGLLVQGARHAQRVELGFASASLLTARVALPADRSDSERLQFYTALEQRLGEEVSMGEIGLVSTLPGTHAQGRRVGLMGVDYERREDMPVALYAVASPSFFPAIGIAATQGRLFTTQDEEGNIPVMIVNARFVEKYLDGTNPIGARIRMGLGADALERTIVGVVPNLWMGAFDATPDRNPAGYYVPLAQAPPSSVAIVAQVRAGDPLSAMPVMRSAAFSVNQDAPIHEVRNYAQVIEQGTWFYGLGAGVLGVCGVAALLLAAVGVYGVIAFSVQRRRREFGVRMALGGSAASIVRLVLGKGTVQLVVGLSLGLALAVLLTRGVESLLFDVSPTDPPTYTGVALVLILIAAAAMLIPATRAARMQPLDALRSE